VQILLIFRLTWEFLDPLDEYNRYLYIHISNLSWFHRAGICRWLHHEKCDPLPINSTNAMLDWWTSPTSAQPDDVLRWLNWPFSSVAQKWIWITCGTGSYLGHWHMSLLTLGPTCQWKWVPLQYCREDSSITCAISTCKCHVNLSYGHAMLIRAGSCTHSINKCRPLIVYPDVISPEISWLLSCM
jgi:hypothetical protein